MTVGSATIELETAPLTRHHLRRGRFDLSYQTTGSGPTVLMLPGFGCSGSSWIPWLQSVRPLNFRAVLVDNRGTGESSVTWPYSMAAMADDAAAILRVEARNGPSLIVGHSMGGMVAQHLALRHPELTMGLVLTASAAQVPAFELAMLRSLPLSILGLISRNTALWSLADAMQVHPNESRERARELMAPLRQLQRGESYSRRNAWMQLNAIARHNSTDALGALGIPVEVLVGAGDRVLAPGCSEVLARRLPQATLTILEEAGHQIPFEAPQAIMEAVMRLLNPTTSTPFN